MESVFSKVTFSFPSGIEKEKKHEPEYNKERENKKEAYTPTYGLYFDRDGSKNHSNFSFLSICQEWGRRSTEFSIRRWQWNERCSLLPSIDQSWNRSQSILKRIKKKKKNKDMIRVTWRIRSDKNKSTKIQKKEKCNTLWSSFQGEYRGRRAATVDSAGASHRRLSTYR